MRSGRRKLLIMGLALGVALGALAVGIVVNASDTTFESTTTTKSHRKPRKPAPKPSPVAYAPCRGGLRFHSYPYMAGEIEVHGVDCAMARQVVTLAHARRPCKADDCHFQGYTCTADVAGTQAVSISCVNGERRLRWLWTGGY